MVVCPVADLVPRCCTSAENERGRGVEENQKQKKKSCGFRGCVLAGNHAGWFLSDMVTNKVLPTHEYQKKH